MDEELLKGPVSEKGSTVQPVYSARSMKCYAVTENELQQIRLANGLVTGTFGLGAALLAFGADLFKDVTFSNNMPKDSVWLADGILWACSLLGLAFWIASLLIFLWSKKYVSEIKKESAS